MAKQSKSTPAPQARPAPTASSSSANASGAGQDAVSLLTADHRTVEQLFEQYASASSESEKDELAHKICVELNVHTILEEQIFYPACREQGVEHEALDAAQVEHDGAKLLIDELMTHSVGSPYFDAKVKVLSDYIRHHVAEEERAGDGIFARASAAGVDMDALGQRISQRKPGLKVQAESPGFRPPPVRSLDLGSDRRFQQRDVMERGYDRDRDEQGRFTSAGGGSYRSRRDDDDDRYYGGGAGGRAHGGWFGNPEDHSRASEEGWQHRGYGGGGYGRGRDYEDDRYSPGGGRGRGHGGWFGDPEGHSRSSEEGWRHRGGGGYSRGRDYEDDRYSPGGGRGRGHGGWFGDPEGHSRASEEGWQHHGGGGGYSRGRDYDDDRYSSGSGRGRGHGGWFGDPEGHSRASEEGWEHRRR